MSIVNKQHTMQQQQPSSCYAQPGQTRGCMFTAAGDLICTNTNTNAVDGTNIILGNPPVQKTARLGSATIEKYTDFNLVDMINKTFNKPVSKETFYTSKANDLRGTGYADDLEAFNNASLQNYAPFEEYTDGMPKRVFPLDSVMMPFTK